MSPLNPSLDKNTVALLSIRKAITSSFTKANRILHFVSFSAILFFFCIVFQPGNVQATAYNSNWFTASINPCTGLANVQFVVYNDESGTTNDDFWNSGSKLQIHVDGAWHDVGTLNLGGGNTWNWNPHDDGYLGFTPTATRTVTYATEYWVASGDEQFYVGFNIALLASDIGKTLKFQITGTWEDGGSSGEESVLFTRTPDATNCIASDATDCHFTNISWTLPAAICTSAVAEIYRNGVYLKEVAANTLSTTDDGTPGTAYAYKVRFYKAMNGYNNYGGFSPEDNGTRKTVPASPPNFAATDDRCDSTILLTWEWNEASPLNFRINRNGVALPDLGGNLRSFVDQGRVRGTNYTYTIQARNECGWGAVSAGVIGVSPLGPAKPADLNAQIIPGVGIRLTWPATARVTGFQIERSLLGGGGSSFFEIDQDSLGYLDESLVQCQTYEYRLRAINDCSPNGVLCDTILRMKLIPDLSTTFNPTTSLLASKGYFSNRVEISWTVQSNSNFIDAYKIYRKQMGTSDDSTVVETLNAGSNFFIDQFVEAGILYQYFIIAESQCEHTTLYSNVATTIGFRSPFGTITGNVSYGGGIAVEGVRITAESTSGIFGNSLLLNGTQSLSISDAPSLDVSNGLLLEAWIKPVSYAANFTVIEKAGSYSLKYIQSSNQYSFSVHKSATEIATVNIPATHLLQNNYSHIAAQVSNDSLQIFVNGLKKVSQSTLAVFPTGVDILDNAANVIIGLGFSGNLDELRIWNIGKSEFQIQSDYSRLMNGSEVGLKVYMRMNEGVGMNAYDISKAGLIYNRNHSAFQGNITWSSIIPSPSQLGAAAYTDNLGNYVLTVPYNNGGEVFVLTPSYLVHEFDPSTRALYLGDGSAVHVGIDFLDKSSFTVTGSVNFKSTMCGVKDALIKIDGQVVLVEGLPAKTDAAGLFTIQVPIGEHSLTVEQDGHVYSVGRFPAIGKYDFQEDRAGVNFTDSTLVKIVGRVVGGLREANKIPGLGRSKNNIGQADIVLTSLQGGGCSTHMITTVDSSGEFVVFVPPLKYNPTVEIPSNPSLDFGVLNQLDYSTTPILQINYDTTFNTSGEVVDVDSIQFHYRLDYILRVNPKIAVFDKDGVSPFIGDSTYVYYNEVTNDTIHRNLRTNPLRWPVFHQQSDAHFYRCMIKVFELYTNLDNNVMVLDSVPTTDGVLHVDNELALESYMTGIPEIMVDLKDVNSPDTLKSLIYSFKAGYPNLIPNTSIPDYSYTRKLDITLITTNGQAIPWLPVTSENIPFGGDAVYRGYMLGTQSKGQQFVTEGPQIPEYILRDPPGSGSSASWEVGSTKTEQTKWNWKFESEATVTDELMVGTSIWTGVGVATPSETHQDQSAGFSAQISGGNNGSQTLTTSATKTVSTSDGTVYPTGADSDVYIGKSKNVEFGIAEELVIIPNSLLDDIEPLGEENAAGPGYSFGKKYGLSVVPGGYETHFKFTEYNIKYLIIPNLIHLRNVMLQSNAKYTNVLPISDDNYGRNNDDPAFGNLVSTPTPNTSEYQDLAGPSYRYNAVSLQDSLTGDSVRIVNYQISKWEEAMRLNEWEKVNAGNAAVIDSLKQKELDVLDDEYESVIARYYTLVVGAGLESTVGVYSLINFAVPGTSFLGYAIFAVTTTTNIGLAELSEEFDTYQSKRQRILNKFQQVSSPANYTLGGGVKIEESMSHESASSFEREIEFGMKAEIKQELEAQVSATGFAFSKGLNLGFTSGRNWSEESEETEAVSYSLEVNAGDLLSVDVFPSMLGWGPVFKTKAGSATSCPYETAVVTSYYNPGTVISPATLQIEKPTIDASQKIITNVPADEPAVFNLTLGNESELNYTEAYNIRVISSSNPFGAIVRIDGFPFQTIEIPGGTSINKVLTIEKGPGAVYDYDNILVVFTSQCQYAAGSGFTTDLGDSLYLSAHFLPTCSKVELANPEDKWVLNNSFNDTMPVAIIDYNINMPDLQFLRVDYKPTDQPNWIGIQTFLKDTSGLNDPDLVPIPTGTPFTLYDWDVSQLPDGDYDLRILSQCIFAENTSVTHTGVIDRINPHLFGNPTPADGILSPNDEISIKFNEPIYPGAINPTFNFDIRGVTNGTEVKHSTSLLFDGVNDYVEVTGGVPLERRDFTIEFSALRTGSGEQAIISQGTDANERIFIGFNEANKFVFRINDQEVASVNAIPANVWTYFAVSYDYELERAELFIANGNTIASVVNAGNTTIYPDYVGSGILAIGKNTTNNSNFFSGNFHELRIWNTARTLSQFSVYKSLMLSGSELGLLYNWRMDEADGIIAEEHIRRRDATIAGAAWHINPNGSSASFDGVDDYLRVTTGDVNITPGMDYTLEFWFNSSQTGAATLFSNGTGTDTESDSLLSWNIIKDATGLIHVKHNGIDFQATSTNYFDGQWHHFAIVFQRAGNLTSYVDGNLQSSTQALPFKQFGGNYMYLGARGSNVNNNESITQFFAGKMDEFRFWSTARKLEQVRRDKQNRMNGDELGLQLYIPFEDYQLDPTGIPILTPGFTEQINDDNHPIAANGGVVLSNLTPKIKLQRPVQAINFSYSINNDQIILTTTTSPEIIENVTLDVTVRGLKDLHGNVMESPVTWIAYVDKNQVVWQDDALNFSMTRGETLSFTTNIVNQGGAAKMFNILDVPSWLTVTPQSGTINPNSTMLISFTVNPDINIGDYANDISLLTDFNFPERMTINLTVRAEEPDWSVNPAQFENFMGIVARLKINNVVSTYEEDIIVAMVGQQVRGVAHLEYVPQLDIYLAFLDIYSSGASPETIEFRIWDASSGTIYSDVLPNNISFTSNAVLGTIASPQVFTTSNKVSINVNLNTGWNWVGWPILQEAPLNINTILASFVHTNNDQIKGLTAYGNYNGQSNQWTGTLSNAGIQPEQLYKLYTALPGTLIEKGTIIDPTTKIITLANNWNWIGFISVRNMSVTQALGNLNANTGDVIKSKTQFATYDATLAAWIGSLKVMKPGEGYMYKSVGVKTFTFPVAGMFNNSFTGDDEVDGYAVSNDVSDSPLAGKWLVRHEKYSTNMTILGSIQTDCGATLVGHHYAVGVFDKDGKARGKAAIEMLNDREVSFLTIAGNDGDNLDIRLLDLEKGTAIDLKQPLQFETNNHVGEVNAPFMINISDVVCQQINPEVAVKESVLTAFPTIFSESFSVDYIAEQADDNATIRITNMFGQVAYTSQISLIEGWNRERIDLSKYELASGLYTVEIFTNGKHESLKMIKAK